MLKLLIIDTDADYRNHLHTWLDAQLDFQVVAATAHLDHTHELVAQGPAERVVAAHELEIGVADPGQDGPDPRLARRRFVAGGRPRSSVPVSACRK